MFYSEYDGYDDYNDYDFFRAPQSYIPMCTDLPQRLLKALKGEQDARAFYGSLAAMAQDEMDKRVISQIANDEKKHFNNFARLYMDLTGRRPNLPPPEKPNIPNYLAGIEKAIFDETDAYEFYRDTILCTNNPIAKQIFFEAMTDENEHAVRLNFLYSKNK